MLPALSFLIPDRCKENLSLGNLHTFLPEQPLPSTAKQQQPSGPVSGQTELGDVISFHAWFVTD